MAKKKKNTGKSILSEVNEKIKARKDGKNKDNEKGKEKITPVKHSKKILKKKETVKNKKSIAPLPPSKQLSKNTMQNQNNENQNTGENTQFSEKEKEKVSAIINDKSLNDLPDAPPNENFSPYTEDTVKREHSQPAMELSEEEKNQPILPPPFEKPKPEDFRGGERMYGNNEIPPPPPPPATNMGTGGTVSKEPDGNDDAEVKEPKIKPTQKISSKFDEKTKDVFKPVMEEEASPEEQRIRREMLVDTLYDGYEMLHRLARHFTRVSENKLTDMEMEGKIDMGMMIDITDTEEKSLFEIVQSYNREVDKVMKVDDDFVRKTKPSLLRICEKHGWGMSDELNLAIQVSKDLATKISVGYQMISGMNRMLKLASKAYMKQKAVEDKINEPPANTQQPAPIPPSPQADEKKNTELTTSPPPVTQENNVVNTEVVPVNKDLNREPEEKQ